MSAGYDAVAGHAAGADTFRVLAPFEQARFTTEAWGPLRRLRAAGVLAGADFEQFVERALMQIDGRVGVDELRALLGVGGDVGLGGDVTIH